MLNEQDKIKELFSEKLGNFEAPVNPALWKGVASQIGSTTAVTASGLTLLSKVIIGAVATTVIGVASYFVMKNDSVESDLKNNVKITNKPDGKNSTNDRKVDEVQPELKVMMAHGFDEDNNNSQTDFVEQIIHDTENKTDIKEPIVDVSEKVVQPPIVNLPVFQQKTTPDKSTQNVQATDGAQKVIPNPIAQSNQSKVEYTASIDKLPNVFSPDGDRLNDELFIEYSGDLFDFNIVIMDKQNRTVYQSQNPNFKWDGIMLNGEPAEKGIERYVYIVTARDSNGNKINKYSSLSIR